MTRNNDSNNQIANTDTENPWYPIQAVYTQGAWRILFTRYGPDGWEFSERIEKDLPIMLESDRAQTDHEK